MKPFIKWAGSKRSLLPKLLPLVPARISTFYEPFVGSGALFFALASEEPRRFKRAVLSDANEELVNCYVQARDRAEDLIHMLRGMPATKERFESEKGMDCRGYSDTRRALRFLYLNRVGFNGLWRVNARGEYNVPFGRRADGTPIEVCPPEYADNLRACSRALQGVDLRACLYEDVLPVFDDPLTPGDFWYFDPPYLPAKSDSFTAYTKTGFGLRSHVDLVDSFEFLRDRGATVLLSNADTAVARDIYRGLKIQRVSARRSISGKPSGRKPARELLVTGGAP